MAEKVYNPSKKVDVEQLREALGNLAWDCQSGWLGSEGISSWSEDRIRMTSNNIIESLSVVEREE